MKVEGRLLLGRGIFPAPRATRRGLPRSRSPVRLVVLTGFLRAVYRPSPAQTPKDDNLGEIEQGTGEVGFFTC